MKPLQTVPPVIPLIYARIISRTAGRTPEEVRRVLKGTGVDEPTGACPQQGMTGDQYCHLLANAVAVSQDPAIILKAGLNLPITTHGDLGIASATAPTFRNALEVFANYTKLRNPYSEIQLTGDAQFVELRLEMEEVLAPQREAALDLIFAIFASGPLRQTGKLHSKTRLRVRRAKPDNAAEYSQLLQLPIQWAQDTNAFVFPSRELDLPQTSANPEEFENACERLRNLYSQLVTPASYRDAVLRIFTQQSGRICTTAGVSQALAISPRTLARHLAAEGTRFQSLLDEWLGNQAVMYLSHGNLSIEATAALMGYSDEANLRRAFKRWFGRPPTQYLRD